MTIRRIERLWLLVILMYVRAVLGYYLVLSPEYSRYDVIKTIEQALVPHQRRIFTLPDIGYGTAGGLPFSPPPELGLRSGTASALTMQGPIWLKREGVD